MNTGVDSAGRLRVRSCSGTLLLRLLQLFESPAYRCIVDTPMRGDLIEPIAMLVRNSYRFVPALRQYPLQ